MLSCSDKYILSCGMGIRKVILEKGVFQMPTGYFDQLLMQLCQVSASFVYPELFASPSFVGSIMLRSMFYSILRLLVGFLLT